MARARPAARAATQLATRARLAPRSRSSGFSDIHQCTRLRRWTAGSSVNHQNAKRARKIPPAITDGSHQPTAVTCATRTCGLDPGTSTPCQRSSQPQACATAYTGAAAMMNVTMAPFDNADVRNAVKYAIDREAIIKQVFGGIGTPGNDNVVAPSVKFAVNPKPIPCSSAAAASTRPREKRCTRPIAVGCRSTIMTPLIANSQP